MNFGVTMIYRFNEKQYRQIWLLMQFHFIDNFAL